MVRQPERDGCAERLEPPTRLGRRVGNLLFWWLQRGAWMGYWVSLGRRWGRRGIRDGAWGCGDCGGVERRVGDWQMQSLA